MRFESETPLDKKFSYPHDVVMCIFFFLNSILSCHISKSIFILNIFLISVIIPKSYLATHWQLKKIITFLKKNKHLLKSNVMLSLPIIPKSFLFILRNNLKRIILILRKLQVIQRFTKMLLKFKKNNNLLVNFSRQINLLVSEICHQFFSLNVSEYK